VWQRWNRQLAATLLRRPALYPRIGEAAGCEYWDPYFASGGYVYTTAMRLLVMQAFYLDAVIPRSLLADGRE
jgi:hypothetical protein